MTGQALRVGGNYVLELIPKTALTPEQMRRGLDILKMREKELKEKYGVYLVEAVFQPEKVKVVFKAGVLIQPIPIIVYAIIALLGIAGIGIIAWKLSEAAKAIPWELMVPVAALGFISVIMYFVTR